ncbi:MAG: M28 family peptidase [Bacteroidota bacterium]
MAARLIMRIDTPRFFYFLIAITLFACGNGESSQVKDTPNEIPPTVVPPVPVFNPDSAYLSVKEQVAFGPRVPNTKAHKACGDYLLSRIKRYCANVTEQRGKVTTYDGVSLDILNIIASFNPEKKGRILLFAHWDTRPWADQDSQREKEPIMGADDGASGVAVLIELARLFSIQNPSVGVDIALFDAEDWGAKGGGQEDSYALGTQYWTRQPHVTDYAANYGILLDMVGSKNAQFRLEGFSREQASSVADKVWTTAANLGYSMYFLREEGGYVTDDHYYVIRYGIPCIDIIHSDRATRHGFGSHWHTHRDDLEIIDPRTLEAVGRTLTQVVYTER